MDTEYVSRRDSRTGQVADPTAGQKQHTDGTADIFVLFSLFLSFHLRSYDVDVCDDLQTSSEGIFIFEWSALKKVRRCEQLFSTAFVF